MKPHKEHEFNTPSELFCYIVESYINGQKRQAKDILKEFLNYYDNDTLEYSIVEAYELYGNQALVSLARLEQLKPTKIVNAFYNWDYDNWELIRKQIQTLTGEYDI